MTASARAYPAPATRTPFRVRRGGLGGATAGPLYFAQVREDPLLEIEALDPSERGTYVVVGSGGCTALSLLAKGAGRVIAVDLNSTQNHVTELKAAALANLDVSECPGFLGGWSMHKGRRLRAYLKVRPSLSCEAAAWYDDDASLVANGVLRGGRSERFIAVLASIVRKAIHPRARIDRLLACRTLEKQSLLYDEEWDNRRWRALFGVLLNRWTLNRTYDPRFFANVDNPSFSAHFRGVFERTIREVPVSTNYFLHQMLTGSYPVGTPGGLPPYLDPDANLLMGNGLDGLELVDGSYQDYLSRCEDSSIDGFALSNICEWIGADETRSLFASVARVAKPGARVCFRNFVGHTGVPAELADVIVEDHAAGAAAIRRDRSCVQARFATCTVEKSA